jgi:hypothetical protein
LIFRSKIDLWLLVVLVAAAALPFTQALAGLQDGSSWISHTVTFALLAGSFSWLVLTTKYTVTQDTLLVQSGPFRWRIAKNEITQIAPSRSILSSPALSLDRLRIEYAAGRKSVLISPKDKEGFLKAVSVNTNAA